MYFSIYLIYGFKFHVKRSEIYPRLSINSGTLIAICGSTRCLTLPALTLRYTAFVCTSWHAFSALQDFDGFVKRNARLPNKPKNYIDSEFETVLQPVNFQVIQL